MDPNGINGQDGDDATVTVRLGRRPHRSILHRHHHAEEDLPFLSSLDDQLGDLHNEFKTLTLVPEHVSIPLRAEDVAFDAIGAAWGKFEQAHLFGVEMEEFLSKLPSHSYTFVVDQGVLARGSRPDAGKLTNLANLGGYGTTINLCKEMVDGDALLIEEAGLSHEMQTAHIPITDNTPPKVHQVLHFLDLVSSKERRKPVYVHCEAGVGRTGVMVACYRMAVMGWHPDNAVLEAKHFGCSLPDQQEFIKEFGEMLQRANQTPLSSHVRAANYPLNPIGSAYPQDTSVLLKNLTSDQYAEAPGPRPT
jgi:protein-tyrosine phosphatase